MNRVTPEDREGYLALNVLPAEDAEAVRAGKWDQTTGLQVFAFHRREAFLQGQMAMRGRAASVLGNCGDMCIDCHDEISALALQEPPTAENSQGIHRTNYHQLDQCPACDGSGEGAADTICTVCHGMGGVSFDTAERIREIMGCGE